MSDPVDSLLSLRREFPILNECTYLVSHSLGAMPRAAARGLERFGAEWSGRGVRAWNDAWWSLTIDLGDELAPLLDAAPGTIVMQPSVTLATAVLLSALSFDAPRNRLVTTSLNFPSLLYLFQGLGERGAEVVRVASDDGITVDTQRLLDAIDEKTCVVAISHALFRSSYVQDVVAIGERAREVGAMFVLDVYQSAGVLPIRLQEWGVDAAVGGCLKWLCGGPGNAFLYVRPDRIEDLHPRLTGWMAHEDPFAFDADEFRPAEGIGRFRHGTPAIPAHRAAEGGLEIVKRAGIEAIRRNSLRQTGRILDRCEREGWPVATPREDDRRGGTVTVSVSGSCEISRMLVEEGILVDHRPDAGIRIAPHFYNTDEEIDRALDEIAAILGSGRWKDLSTPDRGVVT